MALQTKRMILRPWTTADGEKLFELASDNRVGPMAGWPPHISVENSREIIETVLSDPLTFALALREAPEEVIGSIGIMTNEEQARQPFMASSDAEIGYWLGVPFWGKGLMPEAMTEILRYGFEELAIPVMWCGYYEGNEKSKRVQEKAGFTYAHTVSDIPVPLLATTRTEHFTRLTREDWKKDRQK
ncbi:GNAT family N-acetyltransferase [Enterococcus massiliensis]|uniref:GNAT family N-acetyltransferase n=1 Tax=Enterococcus massiliensis TaxID=1640685 RepID=UPI00065E9044|nr:GNAT family N-acetyltransferase [Enterococcus massiliensis]